jgi:hypothetical protein
MLRFRFLLVVIGCLVIRATADTATLRPAADTTLFETFPDNNFGRFHLVAGTTLKQGARSRTLLKFVPGTNLPPGAVISAVQLTVQVDRSPSRPESSTFDLHRMAVDWTEGTGGSGSQAKGTLAKDNESTWNVRLSPSTLWSTPGGAAPDDFAAVPSATARIATRMTFGSTPELVADLQAWIDHPETNFGWIIISESEDVAGTARRFGSRENSPAPTLLVTFTATAPQVAPEITTQPQNQAVFAGEAASFSVVATGTAPLDYRWSLNQTSLAGATNATLLLTNVLAANAGSYTVTVTNAGGSKTSAPATLTLLSPPSIQPVIVTPGVLNLNFTAEAGHGYAVQFLDALPPGNWQTLTNFVASAASANITVADPISKPQRFYRLEATKAP